MGMFIDNGKTIGYYVWDAYNQGNDDSLNKIIVATLAITISIFLIDQLIQFSGDYLRNHLRTKETNP
jgi:ABC-type nitrate/sulfonate/bicarbonate transport system permease component